MTEYDDLPFDPDDSAEQRVVVVEREPRKCRRHQWTVPVPDGVTCGRCGRLRNDILVRRGKQSRNYGNRAELAVAKTYGGTKIGHAGGPVDVRGEEWNTQVKTHRRLPPREWTSAFTAMAANRERLPRLLLRFVLAGGAPPDDYIVIRGSDWLAWFGKDES